MLMSYDMLCRAKSENPGWVAEVFQSYFSLDKNTWIT